MQACRSVVVFQYYNTKVDDYWKEIVLYIILPILFVTLVELDDYLLYFTILKERQKEEIGRGKTFIFLKRELLIWLGVRAVFFWFSFYRSAIRHGQNIGVAIGFHDDVFGNTATRGSIVVVVVQIKVVVAGVVADVAADDNQRWKQTGS